MKLDMHSNDKIIHQIITSKKRWIVHDIHVLALWHLLKRPRSTFHELLSFMETYCSAFTFKNPPLTRRRVGCLPLTRSQLRLIQRGRLWLLSLIQLFQQPVYSSSYVKSWFNLLERLLWSREKNEMYFLFHCIHRFYWSACKAYQKGINLIQGTIAVGQCRVELNIVQYGHLARGSRTFVVFDDHMIIIMHDDLHPMVNGK